MPGGSKVSKFELVVAGVTSVTSLHKKAFVDGVAIKESTAFEQTYLLCSEPPIAFVKLSM
jgi:hypothetical protein